MKMQELNQDFKTMPLNIELLLYSQILQQEIQELKGIILIFIYFIKKNYIKYFYK